MKDRIKAIRKTTGKNQTDFAALIGVSFSSVQKWEMGLAVPASTAIELIAQKTGVSEKWLRTGQGEMFPPRTRSEELAAYFGKVITEPDESYRKRLLLALSELTDDQWQVLIQLAQKMAGVE